MKKIVMIFCFLGLFLSESNAQNEIRFGFQFSPTFSWMKSSSNRINNTDGVILGAKLGAVGEYYFRENYSLATGIGFGFNHSGRLKYEDQGVYWPNSDLTSSDFDTLAAGGVLKYNLSYVEIPFSLKLRSGYFGTFRYFAEIPMLYLGFKSQAKGSISGSTVDTDQKEDIAPDIGFFNLSWGLGGGFEYEIGSKTSLVGGLYYQQGFTDVTKDDGFTTDSATGGKLKDDNSKTTIGAFIVRLGVMF